jgi:hypothetical protein
MPIFDNHTITDLTEVEIKDIYNNLLSQCNGIEWIEQAFYFAWSDFKQGKFEYDGATFVIEVNNNFWEVAAFIHDWLNGIGYVGKAIDLYFIKIMIALNYSENRIFERCKWMQWTFLNVFWHKVKGTFKSKHLPYYLA